MSAEVADKNKKYMEYLQKHASRMKMWSDAHGTRIRPPVWEDEKGNVQWANRAQRRKQGK